MLLKFWHHQTGRGIVFDHAKMDELKVKINNTKEAYIGLHKKDLISSETFSDKIKEIDEKNKIYNEFINDIEEQQKLIDKSYGEIFGQK